MPPSDQTQITGQPRRRADAERSVTAILDAAVDALADDPEVSMAEIARRAGVVRATVYVHFPTRESLIETVTARAIADATRALAAAEPDRGEPSEALSRLVASGWRTLGRYHALVAINTQLPQPELGARHEPLLEIVEPLIRRGQRTGAFRKDVPPAWHMGMIIAVMHAASAELRAGRIAAAEIEQAIVATALGAVGCTPAAG